MNTKPTRKKNTLDLIVTDQPQLIPQTETIPGLSNHNIPYCKFNIEANHKNKTEHLTPIYLEADWNKLCKEYVMENREIKL